MMRRFDSFLSKITECALAFADGVAKREEQFVLQREQTRNGEEGKGCSQ